MPVHLACWRQRVRTGRGLPQKMGLMESGCTRRDFGRDVQPAIPNRPRCWSLVGPTFGAISTSEAESTQHHSYFFAGVRWTSCYYDPVTLKVNSGFWGFGWLTLKFESEEDSEKVELKLREILPR